MGRRSINTTKSGKYMNPTDQASMLSFWHSVISIVKIRITTNLGIILTMCLVSICSHTDYAAIQRLCISIRTYVLGL